MAQSVTEILSYYPNECFVCKKTTALKRCSRCQMISYCEEAHQNADWNLHKRFCNVIFKLMTINRVSHIYEELRGCDSRKWINARKSMVDIVRNLLDNNILKHEIEMLQYPRSCFVCYDTRQNNLTSCSGCPLASFCKEHPRSSRHDKVCFEHKECHYLVNEHKKHEVLIATAIISILKTPMKAPKLPTSIVEYFDQNPILSLKSNERIRTLISPFLMIPLNIFNAIQTLNYTISSKMTVNVSGFCDDGIVYQSLEILLHLFSDLTYLTVVIPNLDKTLNNVMPLCQKCNKLGKKLIVKTLPLSLDAHILLKDTDEPPNLWLIGNLEFMDVIYPPWKRLMQALSTLSCPFVLTTGTETNEKNLFDDFNSPFWKPLIYYRGKNNFGSLCSFRSWKDWGLIRASQFMLIMKAPNQSSVKEQHTNKSQTISRELGENKEQTEKMISKNFFYPGVCHVCKASDPSVTCKRCKMIFYCGEKHMKKDLNQHKKICKVILKFLNEKGTPHLYDNLKTANEESWLKTKLNFINKAKLKLNRDLVDFEEQMFLFPKICFVCRESDLSVLKTCKCGVSLCKIHRDNSTHKSLCRSFSLDLKLGTNRDIPAVPIIEAVPLNENKKNLPASLESFMDSYINLKVEDSNPSARNIIKTLVSDSMTRPLTLIYVLEKLKIFTPKTMIIHIIGAIDREVQDEGYWQLVFYWLSTVQSLTLVFVGVELSDNKKEIFRYPLIFNNSIPKFEKTYNLRTVESRYDKFFESSFFFKPDLIIGYNLDLHESNLGIVDFTWTETLSAVKTLNVPFVLTARSEERARKDNLIVSSLLGNKYEFCVKNPYSSLLPERDFETERLCFSNSYITVYKNFTKTDQEVVLTVENFHVETTDKCVKSVEDEMSELKVENNESKAETTSKNTDSKEKIKLSNEELLRKNLLLQQENKILKENLYLKEENERLRKEVLKLNEDKK